MRKKHWSILGLALGVLVLGVLVGLVTVNTVAADPTPGIKIQIPRVDVGDVFGTGDWETWIQVQNVGTVDTGAIFLGWGDYSELCPTNDPGVVAHYCALIKENALWTLKGQLTDTVKSGIIYTVSAEVYQEACSTAEDTEHDTDKWRCWVQEWRDGTCPTLSWGDNHAVAQGQEVAVTVTRYGPNDYGTFVSSTYTGISEEMEGEDPPYNYYAPYIMKSYLNQLDTEMTIQNSGQQCTSVWIDYMEQGSCYTVYKEHIVQLAPGEAVRVKVPTVPPDLVCDWPGWLGSAHISAEQPLGIIVDQTSFEDTCVSQDRGTLLTYRARPKVEVRDSQIITDTLVYADLIFREWSGWESSIQVQNLSVTSQRTFVTVDFLDNSGDDILFLGDWVCPTGSTTFYLKAIKDLGFKFPYGYVGAAEIQSHDQIAFPGGTTPAQPIFAVVDLKRADDPDTPWLDAQGGSYNAHPYSQKEWVSEIALPFMAKDTYDLGTSWTSMIAIRNNSNCNKIKPKIWFKDETGELLCELQIPWLQPKHVKLIDLDDIGCLYPGYVGAAKVIIEPEEDVEQLCDVDNNGLVDNEPIMPSVIVVEKNVFTGAHGDITNIYEGIPYAYKEKVCYADIMGKVHSYDAGNDGSHEDDTAPLNGVTVSVTNTVASAIITDTTDSTGDYEVEQVIAGTNAVTFAKTGYYTGTQTISLDCGEDEVLDCELLCEVQVSTTAYVSDLDFPALQALGGATVNYSLSLPTGGCGYSGTFYGSTTSNVADGSFVLTVPLVDATLTYTVTKPGIIETRVFTTTIQDAGGQGTYGSVTPLPWTSTGAPILPAFADDACPWNNSGSRVVHTLTGSVATCAYGQVSGEVCSGTSPADNNCTAGEPPIVGGTVTATRIADGLQVTTTTGTNGTYVLQLPTGIAPLGSAASGNTFNITFGATTRQVTFTDCGQAISNLDFDH